MGCVFLIKKPHLSFVFSEQFRFVPSCSFKSQCCSVIAAFHSEEFKSSVLKHSTGPKFDIIPNF